MATARMKVKKPKQAIEYERAQRKFMLTMEKVEKLRNSPAIRDFMKRKEVREYLDKPVEHNSDASKGVLHDDVIMHLDFVKEQLDLLLEISGNKLDLPPLDWTLVEMANRLWEIKKITKTAFEMLGVKTAQSNPVEEAA